MGGGGGPRMGGPMGDPGGRIGHPDGGMGGGMHIPGAGVEIPHGRRNEDGGPGGPMRGVMQLAPPGRWWNDRKMAKSLGLNDDQKKRMDTVFGQNRDLLVSRFDTLNKAQSRLDSLTKTARPSEAALDAEIDHVAQADADLAKTITHLQLQLRDEMTPEQLGKLDDHRPKE